MGRDIVDDVCAEKLSDAELSERLGQYQRQASMWQNIGLLGIAGGLIAAIAVQEAVIKTILVAVLFGGGLCCVLFLSSGAQKKRNALLREQLGGFFCAELEKAFGPDPHTPEMRIDRSLLEALHLLDGQWEECAVENYHEGNYRGLPFSAANVRLDHVYQRGTIREGKETHRDMVFKGLVIRCETRVSASQFTRWIGDFEQCVEGRLLCFCVEGGILSLAIRTDYGFAAVASDVDVRDLDAVRRSYCNSLREMEKTLELLLENTALFTGRVEDTLYRKELPV